MMSLKDFTLIAGALRASKPDGSTLHPFDYEQNVTELNQWKHTCENMADALGTQKNFDRARFLMACGYRNV